MGEGTIGTKHFLHRGDLRYPEPVTSMMHQGEQFVGPKSWMPVRRRRLSSLRRGVPQNGRMTLPFFCR
ncbi:MAG: hypothetical protein ABI641_05050 [Caldimonas sp.]